MKTKAGRATEFFFPKWAKCLTEKLEPRRTKDGKMKLRLCFGDLRSLVFPPVIAAVFRDLMSGGLSDIVSPLLHNWSLPSCSGDCFPFIIITKIVKYVWFSIFIRTVWQPLFPLSPMISQHYHHVCQAPAPCVCLWLFLTRQDIAINQTWAKFIHVVCRQIIPLPHFIIVSHHFLQIQRDD